MRSLSSYLGLHLTSADTRRTGAPALAVERTARSAEPFEDNWNVALTYSYSGGYTGGFFGSANRNWSSTRNANTVINYQLSPGWSAEYAASFDLTRREIGTQRFALTRDLHCWQASFTRTFTAGGEAEYYFRLQVKEQREIYIERGTRSGSIGGIN